jgi:ABC-type transport system involved in multi-copper enzyme maturation permease subunit
MSFSPLIYDFNRTIRSKTVIIISAILIIISVGFIYLFYSSSASLPPIVPEPNDAYSLVKEGEGYSLYLFIFNKYGDPLPNVEVKVGIYNVSSMPYYTPSKLILSYSNYTDSKGIAKFKFNVTEETFYVEYNITKGAIRLHKAFMVITTTNITKAYALPKINFVLDPSDPSLLNIIVFYVESGGQKPNYNIYFRHYILNITGPPTSSHPEEKQWEYLGKLDDYYKIFKVGIKIPSNDAEVVAEVQFRNDEGDVIFSLKDSKIISVPQTIFVDPVELVQSFTTSIFSMFVSLMAILVAYNLYGKDKILGILEYVISKPVTRLGLALSRYTSMILAISLAIFINYLLIYLYILYLMGESISWNILISTILALIVEAAAFIGIILVFSHITKSTGVLLAIGIVMFLILGFFWGIIVIAIAAAFGISLGSAEFIKLSIMLGYLNPIQYPSLVYYYVLNRVTAFGGFSSLINPEEYGITLTNLTIGGIAWSLIPLIIFLYLAKTRD